MARRLRRRRGGTWGGIFPGVNMVIANPHGAKRKLIGGGVGVKSQKITGVNPNPPTILILEDP